MIAFDLQCANDHLFEGWFEDSRAYLDQRESGLVACPFCNNTRVTRIPSTFGIRGSHPVQRMEPVEVPPDQTKFIEFSRKIAEFVENNFDDVGADFSREALKIHYGASEPRSIRGVSTEAEEKTLEAEGIEFVKIPVPIQRDKDV